MAVAPLTIDTPPVHQKDSDRNRNREKQNQHRNNTKGLTYESEFAWPVLGFIFSVASWFAFPMVLGILGVFICTLAFASKHRRWLAALGIVLGIMGMIGGLALFMQYSPLLRL